MGADIQVDGKVAVIVGVPRLDGTTVRATDLRAGAAMIIAGLVAEGTTLLRTRFMLSVDTRMLLKSFRHSAQTSSVLRLRKKTLFLPQVKTI